MGLILLDTSAIAGFLDPADAFHPAADRAMRRLAPDHLFVISAVSYAEILTGAGLGHHDNTHVHGFLTTFISEILPIDERVAARAAELRAGSRSSRRQRRPLLAMPDALILATAALHPEIVLAVGADRRWSRIDALDEPELELLKASAPDG